jgi:hypothetical protein
VIRLIASGFLRHCSRKACLGPELGLVHRGRRRPHYYTRESPMQQWLNLVPMAGALLNLAAAMTNLVSTIINRRGTTSDQVDNETAR